MSEPLNLERTSRYTFKMRGLLFLRSFRIASVPFHVLAHPVRGRNVYREVRSKRADGSHAQACLWVCRVRLECEERASHKPTGIGDEVSRRTSSLRATVSSARSEMPSADERRRTHVVRMLARARKRRHQAQKIVAKWEAKLTELNREVVAAKQPRLWQEEHPFTTKDVLG